ncbi:DUF294 nucleotidyltransferase-like domain-containing protein [Polymorphum gilvum]|uniref:DNA polymerase III, epsilon subunit n=1 Tax=Polymorphum gilvum (strain LMG 25793 / CGMCC 1.9160 / SL003B-26A1) TaxID=991905 RepID=F2J2M0_POLGS|nr:DUF294 nucleotidyltransferase-like domain-containing protein [Polymorphum gilvum]ADZ70934.1 DNA polymerase III, epsilon subunit [Polymorphum gilvum SL003B-26A1]
MRRGPVAGTSAAAPLIALDVVVLDTETTGLDVRHDRIVQIGAVRMHGAEIDETAVFEVTVDPGIPIPEVASRIHGLADADVAGKPGLAAVMPDLVAFIGDAVVVGHSIHFDMAVLRHEAERHGFVWKEPRALDVALMAAGLDRELVDTSLDSLALGLGVTITGRHTALGDALATARVYAALQPKLLVGGVRTLGETETLCRRATGLIARQEDAGWFARPSERPDFALAVLRTGSQRAIDSYLYRQRLVDVMSSPPIAIGADATLHEATRLMAARGIGCVIVDGTGGAPGIVTERDVLAVMADKGPEASGVIVRDIMSAPVITAPADTYLYRALGLMARRNLRYLGVTDAGGRLAGIFTLRTLLRERALATLTVGDEIAEATRPRELARVQAALPSLASGLLADGLDARAVAGIIAAEGRAMTARAAEIAEGELARAGYGPPPADYALLVLGSGGRGESLLAPDQDNALIIAGDYAGDLDSPEDWFVRFATRVNEILDRAGIPYCKGGVMAKNRAWRRTLPEWLDQVRGWTHKPTPQALLNVDIFYDFTPAHVSSQAGAELAETLRTEAVEIARGSLSMLRTMGESAGSHSPPLGMFGRIRKDDAGRVDLKGGGLLPLVAGARAIALRHGVLALATPERILQASHKAGRSQADAELLADIHGFLMRLILTQQIADIEAGVKPSNRIDVNRLGHQDHDQLRDALGRIELIRDILRDLLQGI